MVNVSVDVIRWTVLGTASFNKVPIASLLSSTKRLPSILASNLSNWDWVRVKEFPSEIFKVRPDGKSTNWLL